MFTFSAAVLVSAAVLFLHRLSFQPQEFLWDIYYTRIAINPYMGEGTPWGYRLLTSLLVYWLPFSIPVGFQIINYTALLFSGVVLVYICRKMGLNGYLPFIAVIPFLLSAGVHWQINAIWFNDAVSYLLLSLSILAYMNNRDDGVALFSTIGVMNRSSALFFLPAWYLGRFGWRINRRSLKKLILVWGSPILFFFLLRNFWITLTTYVYKNSLTGVFQSQGFFEFYLHDFFYFNPTLSDLLSRMFSLSLANVFFGPLLPLFILYNFSSSTYRHFSALGLMTWLQFTVATDVGRLETYAFPAVIPLALLFFQQQTKRLGGARIHDLLLGGVLYVFPQSFAAGLILLAILFLIRVVLFYFTISGNGSSLNFENSQEEHSGSHVFSSRWKWVHICDAIYPACLIGLIVIWFLFFCLQTYSCRLTPLLSFPPHLTSDGCPQWPLAIIDSEGKLLSFYRVSTEETEPSMHINIGYPKVEYDKVGIPILRENRQIDNLLLTIWGTNEAGNEINVSIGALEARTINKFRLGSMATYLQENHGFMQSMMIPCEPNDNMIFIGHNNQWRGQVQFILFDASKLIAQNKFAGAYLNYTK
ncbi:MAG: hypothetical protein C4527_03230 [Candidatus Omnitrophota bacterium]|nr:MAG: hypothetical protein C4527_03230 [Candidatus Omnitrophota bacterium]